MAYNRGTIDKDIYERPDKPISRKDVAVILAKIIEVVPELRDEFVPISIEESEESIYRLHFDYDEYTYPDLAERQDVAREQTKKVTVT